MDAMSPRVNQMELRRWCPSAALVVAVHAFIVMALLHHSDVTEAEAGSAIVMMELAPVPVSPVSTPHGLALGPVQLQQSSEDRAKAETEPTPEKRLDESPTAPTIPDAQVTLPRPQPPERPREVKTPAPEQASSIAMPEATAPTNAEQLAPQAAGPIPSQASGQSSQAVATWQRQIASHLQKFKRYPQSARGAQGTVTVSFAIDHDGRVIESHILQSSGSAALDAEALANIKRSEPLPTPPTGTADGLLSFAVPIRYVATAR